MASDFIVYPTIDLRQGQVVRLAQGDPARQTVYSNNPADVARRWQAAGAAWVHVVNLDAAFGEASPANAAALRDIIATGAQVQLGGGLRDEASLEAAAAAGVARLVLGTAAVENPTLVAWAVKQFGADRVAVGIDAREGRVRTRGWAEGTTVRAADLARDLREQAGVEWVIFTDVDRDGIGVGVNVPATAALARDTGLRVIASGGVASLDDVRQVRQAGLAGVVVGRALYEGDLDLAELMRET